jgi:tetratricopeptide (TPR) repeat protein/SAM-dependent methyltransferase
MNRKQRRAANKQAGGAAPVFKPPTAHLVEMAYRLHQSGQWRDAERAYQSILASEPNNMAALQLLGVLSHQMGRHDAAVDLIGRAIKQNGGVAELHYNLAAALQALGRFPEALSHYAEAARLKPEFAEAHCEIGNVFAKQDKLDEAIAQWRDALRLRPNYPVAHLNIGTAFKRRGKPDEAAAEYRKALALDPDYAAAHNGLALLLQQQGRRTEAAAAFRRALELKPDYAEAVMNLGNLVLADGQFADALSLARRALAIAETGRAKALFVQCVNAAPANFDLESVRDLLLRAMRETWIRPDNLVAACMRLIRLSDAGPSGLAPAAADPMLRSILTATPVTDRALEHVLTGLRRAILDAASAGTTLPDAVQDFACLLAQQCFINEFVFAATDDESRQARVLRDKLVAALQSAAPVAPLMLMAVASYFPLHALRNAATLLQRRWPDTVKDLLTLQVRQPQEERALREKIPALTKIEDEVSIRVRGQYEENPYPRWVKIAPFGEPINVDAYLRAKFPLAAFEGLNRPAADILVAGCGTGRYAIEFTRQFKTKSTLALDLSLASLAYAQRQAGVYDVHDIQFAQADIMELGRLGRTFDVIESSGVLHHTAEPLAAWRVLLSALRPRGVMLVGLYSDLARTDITAARCFVAERGFASSADDIRRARAELSAAPDGSALKNMTLLGDYFSTSECRDLLFHVQEQCFTLPAIKTFLTENNLAFLGFDLDGQVLRRYGVFNPSDRAMIDLDRWHAFEQDKPGTFIGMYRFWVQKQS